MAQIKVSGLTIQVVRKKIKNLHLGVYPPDGRVRIAAPLGMKDEAIRLAVVSRLRWIRRHQGRFKAQDRQSPREYVSRESHYFFGRRYLLNVIERLGSARVVVTSRPSIELHIPERTNRLKREKLLYEWYRKQLKAMMPDMIKKWEDIMGVQVSAWGVKRMKTRWGSCNSVARRIWINLELAKKPVECLEYIVVHEMVHLLERYHNDAFARHMDRLLPNWRLLRDQLNSFPLRHERWEY